MSKNIKCCSICENATTTPSMTSEMDLSYHSLGVVEKGFSVFFRTGDRFPTEILFEHRCDNKNAETVGSYIPKYCPECGRRLKENVKFFKKLKKEKSV